MIAKRSYESPRLRRFAGGSPPPIITMSPEDERNMTVRPPATARSVTFLHRANAHARTVASPTANTTDAWICARSWLYASAATPLTRIDATNARITNPSSASSRALVPKSRRRRHANTIIPNAVTRTSPWDTTMRNIPFSAPAAGSGPTSLGTSALPTGYRSVIAFGYEFSQGAVAS